MFSYAARGAAKRSNPLRLPQIENQRLATAPLRRYADLVSQRELAAALRGDRGLSAAELDAVDKWISVKQAERAAAIGSAQQPLMLRALEAQCSRQAAAAAAAAAAVLEGTVTRVTRPAAAEIRLDGRRPLRRRRRHRRACSRVERAPRGSSSGSWCASASATSTRAGAWRWR